MGAALRAMRWKVMGSLPITRFPPNGTLEAPLPPCGASYLLDVHKPRASLAEVPPPSALSLGPSRKSRCPLMAQSGHKPVAVLMSANDPKRTFRSDFRATATI